ncbi:hypothetical protein B296_00036518 [Ensete ventricosum]|uniref:Uncharacterized protein n=1 Tax=Ensete ventricosum TaxID=4639 RepID=A0A427A2E1_ENSVE|nr:hypothetical protein B296_00036518 [Ensete ventricosum]
MAGRGPHATAGMVQRFVNHNASAMGEDPLRLLMAGPPHMPWLATGDPLQPGACLLKVNHGDASRAGIGGKRRQRSFPRRNEKERTLSAVGSAPFFVFHVVDRDGFCLAGSHAGYRVPSRRRHHHVIAGYPTVQIRVHLDRRMPIGGTRREDGQGSDEIARRIGPPHHVIDDDSPTRRCIYAHKLSFCAVAVPPTRRLPCRGTTLRAATAPVILLDAVL